MALLPHLSTIAPRLRHSFRPAAAPVSRPWETTLEDPRVGTVRVTGRLREVPGSEEIVVLVHGLGGSIDSHYMPRGAWAADAAGISSLRVNLRGADRRGDDFYHAGLTADVHAALASEELRSYRRIYLLGYSLGGHVVLRLATEAADPRLAAAAALCSPVNLALSVEEIDSPALWLYRQYLLGSLRQIYAAVAVHNPPRVAPIPVEETARIRTIREWDNRVVAPRHGFADAADYYARMSVAPRLPSLRVPALLLNTECDPMVPARGVRPALENAAPLLTVRWVQGGGHVTFPRRVNADAEVIGWLRGR